jgi:hypothetical protein
LAVSLGVIAYPSPQVIASILQSKLGLPAQFLIGTSRVGGQVKDIARSSPDHLVLEWAADYLAEGVDHLEYSAPTAGSKVPCSDTGLLLSEVIQSGKMAFGKVNDVDVITDCRAVSGWVVFLVLVCKWFSVKGASYHRQTPKASLFAQSQPGPRGEEG